MPIVLLVIAAIVTKALGSAPWWCARLLEIPVWGWIGLSYLALVGRTANTNRQHFMRVGMALTILNRDLGRQVPGEDGPDFWYDDAPRTAWGKSFAKRRNDIAKRLRLDSGGYLDLSFDDTDGEQ